MIEALNGQTEELTADVLIIGGGTAGCMAAVEIKENNPELDVLIVEKADIERSGCLAAGMNAINLYLHPGETPESFVEFARREAIGVLREDLVHSLAEEVNNVVHKVEGWGLPILKDEDGNPAKRGRWNLKIMGERLKPIIAEAAERSGARVLNRVNVVELLKDGDRVVGAAALGVRDGKFYSITAKATIVTTGGASGIYSPNNPGSGHHKIWYSPFNTGAGYAMGIRAGAEMTSFEMRFVALRTKDSIAPTGTLALGYNAPQVNAKGEQYMKKRFADEGGEGAPTCYRVYGPIREIQEGRGPCYMDTTHLNEEQVKNLKTDYLNMYPDLVLYWAANKIDPSKEPIELGATEPYIVGGHCQSGYWIDVKRRTTMPGLYAAGDVAGGAPYKFVSGCWAEAVLAARAAVEDIADQPMPVVSEHYTTGLREAAIKPVRHWETLGDGVLPAEMEERLQKVMDEYAGGASVFYELNDERLERCLFHLDKLKAQQTYLGARDAHELMQAHEVMDRVVVAEAVTRHLLHRKETRWPGFQTRLDYPERDDDNWVKFVNSRLNPETGTLEMIERPMLSVDSISEDPVSVGWPQ